VLLWRAIVKKLPGEVRTGELSSFISHASFEILTEVLRAPLASRCALMCEALCESVDCRLVENNFAVVISLPEDLGIFRVCEMLCADCTRVLVSKNDCRFAEVVVRASTFYGCRNT